MRHCESARNEHYRNERNLKKQFKQNNYGTF